MRIINTFKFDTEMEDKRGSDFSEALVDVKNAALSVEGSIVELITPFELEISYNQSIDFEKRMSDATMKFSGKDLPISAFGYEFDIRDVAKTTTLEVSSDSIDRFFSFSPPSEYFHGVLFHKKGATVRLATAEEATPRFDTSVSSYRHYLLNKGFNVEIVTDY